MNSAICDFCGETIKTKRQYYIEIHSCITGTSNYPDGRMEDEKWHDQKDVCNKCALKLKLINKKI